MHPKFKFESNIITYESVDKTVIDRGLGIFDVDKEKHTNFSWTELWDLVCVGPS